MNSLPKLFFLIFAIFLCQGKTAELLDPLEIESLMFTEEITGVLKVATSSENWLNGKLMSEDYTITMQKGSQKMLPGNYPKTELYVYSTKTSNGVIAEFPGPTIIAKKDIPIKITWVNNISGPHMLPMDFSKPFYDDFVFRNEVPTVPHAHGVATKESSDGEPMGYWTASGSKSEGYKTEEPCSKNQAIYKYPNEQDPGLFWYHDHTIGITRLNVYAGLAGLYEIVQNPHQEKIFAEENILKEYGANLTQLYFTIADKSFTTEGQLFYPEEASSELFSNWVPEFYGNTITVNGKVWPKINLEKKKYRLIFLNACQCRYLNIYFLHAKKKLPFELVRIEGDYFSHTIVVTEFLLTLSARLEIILDLTQINGEVIMKNNAVAPYPDGDPENLVDKFTGTIMKIVTNSKAEVENKRLFSKFVDKFVLNVEKEKKVILKENAAYPAFPEGEPVFIVLNEVEGEDGEVSGVFINGVGMEIGHQCEGHAFNIGKTYDFYLINLTPDSHPIHFHLINFQKIKTFPFKVEKYKQDWFDLNGGEPSPHGYNTLPKNIDPRLYKSGSESGPADYEKVFRDVIDAHPEMVTVVRIKFSHNNGKPFSFDVSGSKYVFHCHMLEHEDNEMMSYFCLK